MKMRLAFALAVLMILAAIPAQAADPIGLVISVEGLATGQMPDGTNRVLQLKSPIYLQDRIITGKGAKLQIMFNDDTIISQGEKSEMVIDEYVYTKASKAESKCSLRFLAGCFRAITGKITDLNPDRFKVKTRMATIGIRGCDVAFEITQTGENIYVIELPDNRKIYIETTAELAQGQMTGQQVLQILEVLEPGIMVTISESGQMEQRPMTLDEARSIIEQTTPKTPPDDTVPPDTGEAPPDNTGQNQEPGSDELPPPGTDDMPPPPDPLPEDNPQPGPINIDLLEPTPTPTPEPTATPTPEPAATSTSTSAENTQAERASGLNWAWGIWKDPQGNIFDTYTAGNILAASDVQGIIAGANTYNLSGSGLAGAVITAAGQNHYVEGPCNLSVAIPGNSLAATWDGSFTLNNAAEANSLIFNAAGPITAGSGNLKGSAYTYSLNMGPSTYGLGTLSRNEVNGSLVGPGATTPISGAVGDFHFAHGANEPTVNGAYGSDLDP